MSELRVGELKAILSWIVEKLEEKYGSSLDLNQDFYRTPASLGWFFDYQSAVGGENFGSFADEIDLLRKSILSGEGDLPDVVLERAGYLLLYLAHQIEGAAGDG